MNRSVCQMLSFVFSTCCLVFTRSIGVMAALVSIPPTDPAMKFWKIGGAPRECVEERSRS